MLLGLCASLVNELAALASTLGQLLVLVLDLSVKAFKHRQDRALDCLGRFGVGVGNSLIDVRKNPRCTLYQDVLLACSI